jgi:hypothetical protein
MVQLQASSHQNKESPSVGLQRSFQDAFLFFIEPVFEVSIGLDSIRMNKVKEIPILVLSSWSDIHILLSGFITTDH